MAHSSRPATKLATKGTPKTAPNLAGLAAGASPNGTPSTSIPWAALIESFRYLRATVALVWKSSPWLTMALAVSTLFAAIAPLGVAYAGKRIVDAVLVHSKEATIHWVLAELGLIALQATLTRAVLAVRTVLGARLGVDLNVAILEKAVSVELFHFEDSEFYDSLTRARREASSRPVALVTDGFLIAQNLITLVGYGALLLRFSPWAALVLVVATIPATVAEVKFSKRGFHLRNRRSPEARRLTYFEYVLANDEHVKEVRLFGLGDLFLGRYKELSEQFYAEDKALALKRSFVTHGLSLLATAALYGAYAFMAIGAALGRITLGNMTLYVVAFRNGQTAFQSVLSGLGSIYEHNLYMSNLLGFLATPVGETLAASSMQTAGDNSHVKSAEAPELGIRFEDVGFKYPMSKDATGETWALRHVNLFIPKGQSLALVGENGAGKTTFIKLLTKLYQPTEGRILLDGKDIRAWDEQELRARFGVVFQDYNQYHLSLSENIGVGSVRHLGDVPRIERAAARGGADELVPSLEGGFEATLGRWFSKGTELSGGQWQKVALSRAFMRDEADILILDEPTAALDAKSEHAVFERFRILAQGRTTIVISHRFPTVRMADRILVIERGEIVEEGTHGSLVAEGGRYAKMFALQAEGYL
ncbi:MAG: ABC transporter ATP-binding protein [Polyangiaceae bacterium]